MSRPAPHVGLLTVEAYLEREMDAPVRHEYVAGEVHAMTGGSKRHNRVSGNVFAALRRAAGGGSCRVYIADVKLRAAGDVVYYPDVMVACAPDSGDPYVEEAPCLVVEVTSPTTEVTDRREKLLVYRQVPTLGAYLLVDPGSRRIDRHWRDEGGAWRHELVTGGSFPVPCPETVLSVDDVFEGAGAAGGSPRP